MEVPSVLLDDVAYESIVRIELSAHNRFLPPNLADAALRPHATALADWLRTVMRRPFQPDQQDTVLARKLGGGSRPLPFLSLRDRLIFRALVSLIRPNQDGVRGDYDAFKRTPLSVEACRYVLKTDIAAYYQYIDHERLIDEVVAQVGDDLAIVNAVELLQGGTSRRFGLPQMSGPSDVLSEIYIDPIRRDLIRAGFDVARFADDFRVSCTDYHSALAALELTERLAFANGLVLNEGKTSTPSLGTYEASLGEVAAAESELFALMNSVDASAVDTSDTDDLITSVENFFMTAFSEYDELDDTFGFFGGDVDDEADPPASDDDTDSENDQAPSERQTAAALFLLDLWDRHQSPDRPVEGRHWSRAAWSNLLRKALAVLSAAADEGAIEHVTALLVYEPDLTPQVCAYLSVAAVRGTEHVSTALDTICDRQIVRVWQSLWIAHCAGTLPERTPDAEHVQWLRTQMVEAPHALAVQAALALARRRLLEPEEAAATYERATPVHKPSAFLALAGAMGQHRREVVANNQVERWQAEWVKTQRWGRPERRLPRARKRR